MSNVVKDFAKSVENAGSNLVNEAKKDFSNIGNALNNTAQKLGTGVDKIVNGVVNIAQDIAKNPLPIIETIVLTAALGPAGAGFSTALAGATAGAAVTAANGGNARQILTGAAAGGIGSEVASYVPGSAPITAGAVGGGVSGGVSAAAQGKDIGKGIAQGAATGGLSSGIQQGLLATQTPSVNYNIATGQNLPTQGLGATPDTTSFSSGETANANLFKPQGTDVGLTAKPSTDTTDYSLLASGSGGGEGISSTPSSSTGIAYNQPTLSATEKTLANYVASDIVRQSGLGKSTSGSTNPSTPSTTSAVSNVALGSQQSPNSATGADIANLDPQGIGTKQGKIGGQYPWGEPEGTTKLKDQGQVV